MDNYKLLYSQLNEEACSELSNFFSSLFISYQKYFNEVIFMRINKDDSSDFSLIYGLTTRSEDQPKPSQREIDSVLTTYLLFSEFVDDKVTVLKEKKGTDFDVAYLIHENVENSDLHILFFNHISMSLEEIDDDIEKTKEVFLRVGAICENKLLPLIKKAS